MPTWPAYAEIKLDGFGIEHGTALARTDMESGPPVQTRVKSRVMVTRALVVWFMSKADYLSFLEWWRAELGYGAAWFDYDDPVTDTTLQMRIAGGKLGRAEPAASIGRWHLPLTVEHWSA
jgi:hypothetical protein